MASDMGVTTAPEQSGYVRQRPVYKLVFEDPSMAGLVVRVRALSFGEAITIHQRVGDDNGRFLLEPAAKEFFREDVFVDWNLRTPEGEPVTGTVEGLYTQDRLFIERVLAGWLSRVEQVPAPLGEPSPDGEPFPEGSIPMEVSSESPPS